MAQRSFDYYQPALEMIDLRSRIKYPEIYISYPAPLQYTAYGTVETRPMLYGALVRLLPRERIEYISDTLVRRQKYRYIIGWTPDSPPSNKYGPVDVNVFGYPHNSKIDVSQVIDMLKREIVSGMKYRVTIKGCSVQDLPLTLASLEYVPKSGWSQISVRTPGSLNSLVYSREADGKVRCEDLRTSAVRETTESVMLKELAKYIESGEGVWIEYDTYVIDPLDM